MIIRFLCAPKQFFLVFRTQVKNIIFGLRGIIPVLEILTETFGLSTCLKTKPS